MPNEGAIRKQLSLRCTVSGGLETLAFEEAKENFPSAQMQWSEKGNSGSQLRIDLDYHTVAIKKIRDIIRRLRYIDYIYAVVHSDVHTEVPDNGNDMLLSQITLSIESKLDRPFLNDIVSVARACQEELKECSVGLEELPGRLLPTPILDDPSVFVPTAESNFQSDINTIYTKDSVARSVVASMLKLVSEEAHSTFDQSNVLWIDAGAGSGALLGHLPEERRIGVDLKPVNSEVLQANYLETTRQWIQQRVQKSFQDICVISNPPFASGSRGDFSSIVAFVNHSIELGASYVGLIVPSKFARLRIWKSLGMNPRATLLTRFFLPQESFYNPSTGRCVHIHAYFLLLAIDPKDHSSPECPRFPTEASKVPGAFCLAGKRDKGQFRGIATADLITATATALEHMQIPVAASRVAELPLTVKLHKSEGQQNGARSELWLLLNPEKPLSLANSASRNVEAHSLGWLSTSVKPPIAYGMLKSLLGGSKEPHVLINAMSGEGTIELEAQHPELSQSLFVISGDKNERAASQSKERLEQLRKRSGLFAMVDVVVWDAQNLPLRKDIADMFVADLPFMGSTKKKHQEPSMEEKLDHKTTTSSLDYNLMLSEAFRVLRPLGEASFLSADAKALVHSASKGNWHKDQRSISKLSVGGLNAQLLILRKKGPCFKDMSMWVDSDSRDLSVDLLDRCRDIGNSTTDLPGNFHAVLSVSLVDTFYHEAHGNLSHCYRFVFEERVSEKHAKIFEKVLRKDLSSNPIPGVHGLR